MTFSIVFLQILFDEAYNCSMRFCSRYKVLAWYIDIGGEHVECQLYLCLLIIGCVQQTCSCR